MESSVATKPVDPEQVNPFDEFPPEIRKDVDGLIHLGSLQSQFEFCGHNFTIRTLRAAEEIAAGQAVQEYRGGLKEAEAYAAAQAGLALVFVDGDDSFCPQAGPDQQAFATARFNYITTKWYWPTIEFVYKKLLALNARQILAFQEIQNLSSRSPTTSTPLSDSLIQPEFSPPGTSTEFPDLTDSN